MKTKVLDLRIFFLVFLTVLILYSCKKDEPVTIPAVTTLDATFTPPVSMGGRGGVNGSYWTLHGTVNANGLTTIVGFEWQCGAASGFLDATPNPVTGDTFTYVSAHFPTAGAKGITCSYQVIASSTSGTVVGDIKSFIP